MNSQQLRNSIESSALDARFSEIYPSDTILAQRERYVKLIDKFESLFGEREAMLLSVPGRVEVCGNHTDHQGGQVLAAAINLDIIAVCAATEDTYIRLRQDGFGDNNVDISNLAPSEIEQSTSPALVRGVAAFLSKNGAKIGGIVACVDSQVPAGGGLSSSAAYGVMIGNMISQLYNNGAIEPIALAKATYHAEREYYGKPVGLMDQTACAVGGLVHIDFANSEPIVNKVTLNSEKFGHALCIIDTGGDHTDLTPEYAAVPGEMKAVAQHFGAQLLSQVDEATFWNGVAELRNVVPDRAIMRAAHYYAENARVATAVASARTADYPTFFEVIKQSGSSSHRYLQNVAFTQGEKQNLALALSVTEKLLGNHGAFRVHGGGFEGSILAMVPQDFVTEYSAAMNRIFGENACTVLQLRKDGAVKI